MHLMDWHRCSQWNLEKWTCPYIGEKDHEEPDEEEDVKDRAQRALEKSGAGDESDLYFPGIPLFRSVREIKRQETPDPLREPGRPIPFPKPIPHEIPEKKTKRIAAFGGGANGGELWLNQFYKQLNQTRYAPAGPSLKPALANAPALASSPAAEPLPKTSTSSAVRTAAASESALTKSLRIYVKPPNLWDTGARTPQRALAQYRYKPQPRKRAVSESKGLSTGQKLAAAAATTVIGAGAAYLAGNTGRGRGGQTGRSAAWALTNRGAALAR